MGTFWLITGFSYFLLVNIGLVAYIISLSCHLAKRKGFSIDVSVPKVIGGLYGFSVYALFAYSYLDDSENYILLMAPFPAYLMPYVFPDFFLDLPYVRYWQFLFPLAFGFLGGWGLGQIVDWIRKK